MAQNTLFLFASDNGPSLRWGLGAGSMGIFTGSSAAFENGTAYTNTGKGSTWEGGIRMPAFAYMPGWIEPHTSTAEIVSTMDVLPTFLKLAQWPVPEGRVLDGKDSLYEILFRPGGSSKHAFLPFYNGYYGNVSKEIYAGRYGRYKAHGITSPGLNPNLDPNVNPNLNPDFHPHSIQGTLDHLAWAGWRKVA